MTALALGGGGFNIAEARAILSSADSCRMLLSFITFAASLRVAATTKSETVCPCRRAAHSIYCFASGDNRASILSILFICLVAIKLAPNTMLLLYRWCTANYRT